MDDFKIKFRGVRGSFPVANKDFLNYGGNTSCVEVSAGNVKLILDAGTGIVNVGDELMEEYISSSLNPENRTPIDVTILISHIHFDHLAGLTFFKPLHVKSSNISIFGGSESKSSLSQDLSALVFGKTFPLDLGDIACNLTIRDITDEGRIVLTQSGEKLLVDKNYIPNNDDVIVDYYKSYVHPQNGVYIFKISYDSKSVVYATDKECYMGGDKKFTNFAQGCNLLIHDAQYTTEDYMNPNSSKQGFGHSTFDMAVEIMKQSESKMMAFFHYDPEYNDSKIDKIKEFYLSAYSNVMFSYENLEMVI